MRTGHRYESRLPQLDFNPLEQYVGKSGCAGGYFELFLGYGPAFRSPRCVIMAALG